MNKITNMPFYAWDCVTFQLEGRDVDLVIRDQDQMMKLLKFLTFHMKSLDGTRGSGREFIKRESRAGKKGGLMNEK